MKPLLALGPAGEVQALLERLAAELGIAGPLLQGHDTHGRPTLSAKGRTLAFSRTRAEDRCAVALALEGRVGVDLVAPTAGNPEGLESHFHPSEQDWLRTLQGEARRNATLRCWAAKEAILKALGLGLAFGPEVVELVPEDDEGLRVARIAGQCAEGWNLEISRAGEHVLALAWAN